MLEGEIVDGPLPPARIGQRLHAIAEEVRYVARPGLGALPTGTFVVTMFAMFQMWSLSILLWAIWWPAPPTPKLMAFAIGGTVVLAGLVIGVAVLLMLRFPGYATAILRAPFIRVTVTDRRVIWSVPWDRRPLMELDRRRVTGALLGIVDKRGRGNAAIMLVPGDPAADIDGNIHFDRLPGVLRFVAAFGG